MKDKDSESKLEKNFKTQSTFKRNSRYYDAQQIANTENQFSIHRRKPIGYESQAKKDKVEETFTHSTTVFTGKLKRDIDKFRNRISISEKKLKEHSWDGDRNCLSPKMKSFSIEKMMSRKQIEKVKAKVQHDERQFSNFKIEKSNLSKTFDFGKRKGRNLDSELKHINDIYHEKHLPLYQQYFYKRSTTNCKFDYKVQNKNRKRYFFNARRPQNDPSTQINPEKVDQGLKVASNFKGSNIKNDGWDPFYKGSGRDLPTQLDSRKMNPLIDYYRRVEGKIESPQLDYTVMKLKEDMVEERKRKLKGWKKAVFERNQICDERYFKKKSG